MLRPQFPLWLERHVSGSVVLPFNGHLLSGLVVPIHFFIAFFRKQLVSRRVLLHLVVGNNGLGRFHCRLNRLNPLNGCSSYRHRHNEAGLVHVDNLFARCASHRNNIDSAAVPDNPGDT